ncbi:MAG: hypothetical protein HDT44_09630 [Ruminococcaceae bacterium]|nr:hypothetical protein [Oscillospiraceae bacterium]
MSEDNNSVNKTADIEEYRKKVKQRKLLVKLIVILALILGFFILLLNLSDIMDSLKGIASKIDTKTSNDVGYPIKLSGSASYAFEDFGENFSLLSDTYLYTYNLDGGQNYALKHSYSKPVHCANSKRILLYDKDYNDFSLYSKTRLIYKGSVEEKIVFGTISNKETVAIVTNSDKYSNNVYIYNGNGEWKYTRKFLNENVMNVGFSSDDRYIYVVTLGAENGDIYSTVYKYDTTNESDEVWSYRLTKASIPLKVMVKKNRVCIIYDNYAVSLNEADGSLQGEKEFQGTVTCFDNSDSVIGLIYYDSSSNKDVLMSFDYDMKNIAGIVVDPSVNKLITDNNTMYIIQSGKITGYNSEMKITAEKQVSDDCVSFVKIGSTFLLLGYNSIEMVTL